MPAVDKNDESVMESAFPLSESDQKDAANASNERKSEDGSVNNANGGEASIHNMIGLTGIVNALHILPQN